MRNDDQLRAQAIEADQWIIDLAHIFAEGVLRLHRLGQSPLGPDGLSLETALKTARQGLELSSKTSLSVHQG